MALDSASTSASFPKPATRSIASGSDVPPLRILCTEIVPFAQLQARAERELGFPLQFICRDFVTAQRIAATEPDSYDVYDQCFHNLDIVWHWRAVQPIAIERIDGWDEISDLTKKGRIAPGSEIGFGDAPVTRLYVQKDNSLGSIPTRFISMLPTVHNFDSFGVNETASGVDTDHEVTSWAELLDKRWFGRVSIVDEPAIGIFDLALAARSAHLVELADPGNMTTSEIDTLIELALSLKSSGHFAPFWRTAEESEKLLRSGAAWIGSIWSPTAVALKTKRIALRQAVPREGYRGWHGGLCLARHLENEALDRGYAYLNWFLSSWPSAVVARQGYYMPIPDRAREMLEPDEWDYWYNGLPARRDLPDPSGRLAISAGGVRSGGSYWKRASRVALWNTTMDEHNYLVRRWSQLVGGPVAAQRRKAG